MTTDRRWFMLAVLFVARTAMGFQFQSVASTAPLLVNDLHVGFGTIGTLIGLYMLPGVAMAFPGGLLSQRFGDKKLCAAGLAMMMAGGVMMGVGHAALPLFLGRILSGTGAVLFNLVLTKMVTDWFADREIVLAMAIILATWPLGVVLGLLAQPPMAAAFGWMWVMQATAIFSGASLLLIGVLYRDPDWVEAPSAAAMLMLPPLREMLPTTVAGVMWGGFNLAFVLFFSFAPALLSGLGLPAVTAAAWVGAGLWVVMVALPLAGVVVQRSGRSDVAVIVAGVAGALVLALLPMGVLPLALCAAFGVTVGLPAGAIMGLLSGVLSPANRAGGLGVFYTIYYAFMAFGPAVAGYLRQIFGTPAAAILLGAGLFAALVPLLWLFTTLARQNAVGWISES